LLFYQIFLLFYQKPKCFLYVISPPQINIKKMKHSVFTLAVALFATMAMAQTTEEPLQYDMAFKGRGEATTVQSVTVENLSRGMSKTLEGSKVLRLTNALSSGTETVTQTTTVQSVIYPNPSYGQAQLTFANRTAGDVQITIFDITGKSLFSNTFQLETGKHTAILPAMQQGQYIINLRGKGISESVKWISLGGGSGSTAVIADLTHNPLDEQEIPASAEKTDNVLRFAPTANLYVPVAPVSNVSAADLVEMEYHAGELLRFTGTSGTMKTIVMNTPTLSHDIIFDFYACTDAAGRHYPIVYAGGYMWMAEDLGAAPSVVPVTTSADDWGTNAAQAQSAFADFGATGDAAYYNFAGAKAALPEGWTLPTANDWEYIKGKYSINHLTSDTLGLLLEQSGYIRDWTGYQMGGSDITFQGINAMSMYWTGSTKSGTTYTSVPMSCSIFTSNNTVAVQAVTNGRPANNGLRVRGIRPAITPFKELNSLFAGANDPQGSPRMRAAVQSNGFEGYPLGEKWTTKSLELNMPVVPFVTSGSSIIGAGFGDACRFKIFSNFNSYTTLESGASGADFTNYELNTYFPTGHPSKVVVQNMPNGKQNLIFAYWNATYSHSNATNTCSGTHALVFNINEYDFDTKEYKHKDYKYIWSDFQMPDRGTGTTQAFLDYNTLLHISCVDYNNDNTDDLVVAIGNKVAIYDGTDYSTKLAEKTFPDAVKKDVAVTVSDFDEDGALDVAVAYSRDEFHSTINGVDNYWVQKIEVYSGGLHEQPDYYCNKSARKYNNDLVYDIKIMERTASTPPRIAVLSNRGVIFYQYAETASWVVNLHLNELELTNIPENCRGIGRELHLARLRGTDYPADLIIPGLSKRTKYPNGVFSHTNIPTIRYRDYAVQQMQGISTTPGSLAVGNFINDPIGREQLLYDNVELVLDQTNGNKESIRGFNEYANKRFICLDADFEMVNAASMVYLSEIPDLSSQLDFWQMPLGSLRKSEKVTFQFKQHDITMSNPTIYALLTAPPYYKENPDGSAYSVPYSQGTSWGKTVSSTTTKSEYSTESSTDVVGLNCTFALPGLDFIGGGGDWTKNISKEWGSGTETSKMVEYSTTYTAENQHCVVLSAYYYDHYTYEAVAGNPDILGSKMNISIPYGYEMMRITLDDYNRVRADREDIPDVNPFFKVYDITQLGGGWTTLNGTSVIQPGYPFSYPKKATDIINGYSFKRYKPTCDDAGTIVHDWLEVGFVGIGSGGATEQQITVQEGLLTEDVVKRSTTVEQSSTWGWYNSGHTDGGNKEIARGFEVINGLTVGGQVSGLRSLGENGLPNFKFNLVWYYGNANGNVFPVVNYLVKE
jgi:uncharacterized protein (TIGR02145 family)